MFVRSNFSQHLSGFISDFENAKSYEQLISDNTIFSRSCIRPDPIQSISSIRKFIYSIATQKHHQIEIRNAESILLFGLDSIGYRFAKSVFAPDHSLPLTSVFPSTSVCAWTYAFTGYPPEITRMISPIFYCNEIDDMYITLTDTYGRDGHWKNDLEGAEKFPIPHLDNIFSDLNPQEFDTVCINGAYAYSFSRWSNALLYDARKVYKSSSDWNQIALSPEKIVAAIIEDVTVSIRERRNSRKLFTWYLVELDSYVHVHGYSRELELALTRLDSFFRDLSSNGHLVIMFADHGQVPQVFSPQTEKWHDVIGKEFCRYQPAGAGRTRWCYPRPKFESFVFERSREILGENAIILHRDEIVDAGLMQVGPNMRVQVGEIIALALTEKFPLAVFGEGFTHEHGSVGIDEMLVPLMVWER